MSRPIRILELRSVRGTGGGPEKTILLGAARTDPSRFRVTVCYLRDERDTVFDIPQRLPGAAVDYREIVERGSLDPRIWPALQRVVHDCAPDLVHAHDYKTNLLGLALWRLARVKALATAHGWTGHSAKERYLYYPADKRVLARYPRVVAVSSEIRDELIACGAPRDRVTTILNGIDHEAFRHDAAKRAPVRASLGLNDTHVVVGAVGRLEPQKRFDVLLDTAARLRQTRPELRVVIVGDGSLRRQLEHRAAADDLAGACVFTGHVHDIASLHHAFDLFVQTSDYEGTPNAVLEAMALETPTVATAAGGTAELMTNGVHGVVVAVGDRVALTTAVARALDHPDDRLRLARAARLRVERELSFDARMRRLEAIYQEMVHCPAGTPALAGSC